VASGKSLLLSLRNVQKTFSTSSAVVMDAVRGGVSREACDGRLETWASRVVANSEMMVSVQGRENVDPKATYLVMSNHQSHYDVAVIYYVLGARIRMVAKRELFSVPVFGNAMRAAGFISVDRASASLADARRALEEGTPIWIAPEGTRSPTGELLPFEKGGFVLAVETGTPVLPVSIAGTREVLRAKGMLSRAGVEVFVTIHPPVDPRRWADKDAKAARDALSAEVRSSIASGL